MQQIDVITLCGADGEVRPLRIRAVEETGETIIGNVRQILVRKENKRVCIESILYLCRIELEGRNVVAELKFHIRSHSWYLTRRLY